MRFTVSYPLGRPEVASGLADGDGMARMARAIEQLGFDAIAFTEHPAPNAHWLQHGGHLTLDVPAALSFCAAVTTRVRLMSYLLVLPYHNPFVAAKAVTSIDRLSDGRAAVVAGTGYLQSEFKALGLDVEQRNELFDEAIEVLRACWSGEPVTRISPRFRADGVVAFPLPIQAGGPPIYVGGNGRLARRRAAQHDGWSPLLLGERMSANTRTAALADIDALATAIGEVRAEARELRGSAASTFVQVQTRESRIAEPPAAAHRGHLDALEAAGVDAFVVAPPGDSVDVALAALERYAGDFLR